MNIIGKNIAGICLIHAVFAGLTLFLLCPSWVEPNVGGVRGGVLTPHEWTVQFASLAMWSIALYCASALLWMYLSARFYRIDYTGQHTQMWQWVLHAFGPTAAMYAASHIALPPISEGWTQANVTCLVPGLLAFWVSTLFFSQNRVSVPGGALIR